jgi:hypothetical protein
MAWMSAYLAVPNLLSIISMLPSRERKSCVLNCAVAATKLLSGFPVRRHKFFLYYLHREMLLLGSRTSNGEVFRLIFV